MSSSTEMKSSIEAAQEAIAKVNAMLIAKGKLKPSQLGSSGSRKPGAQGNIVTKEVEINDVPIGCRNMLTRGATQEEISKMSGAAVATKGRYMTQEERARHPKERPLFLHVQASTQDAVNLAVGKINEIIATGIAKQGQRMGRFSPTRGVNFGSRISQAPQPLMPNQNIQLLQEKLYIGLEHAPPNFSVKDKIFGVGGSFLQHIQAETGAKVTLRGKGSGFIEITGGEAMEPMHIHLQHVNKIGLQQAKDLATNLIQTVQQEYASFQQSFVSVPPPNLLPQPQPMMLPPQPHVVSLAQPPPLLPGQQIFTSVPPPTLIQPPPLQAGLMPPPPLQASVSVSLPAPGVVIPQLASSTQQPPPGPPLHQMPPPLPNFSQPNISAGQQFQLVHSSDIGGQIGSQQMFVSTAGQQPGQVVLTTVGGPQIQQPIPQLQAQLGPPATIQFQQGPPLGQPGPIHMQPQVSLPQQILQPPGLQPQPGTIQQVTIQHQQQQQQPPPMLMQQPQPSAPSGPQPFIQQPLIQSSIQQMPPGSIAIMQQPGPPHSLQASPPQQLHLATVDQPPPMGQGTVAWGTVPSVSFTTVPSPSPVPLQQPGIQHIQQPNGSVVFSSPHANQNPDMIMSSPQTQASVISSSGVSPVTSSTSSYVYKTGPLEEPRRRFTEEKQDDKLPEGLLGYEHGPPHLTNLMVQSGQHQPHTAVSTSSSQPEPAQTQPPPIYTGQMIQQVQGQPLPQGDLQPQPPQQIVYAQPNQQQHLIVTQQPGLPQQPPQLNMIGQQQGIPQHHLIHHHVAPQIQTVVQQSPPDQHRPDGEVSVPAQSQSPVPSYVSGVPGEQVAGLVQVTSEDQMLMPPPPPPMNSGNLKRHSPGLAPGSSPEPRKKAKGFHDDDDDHSDIPSSMSSQIKELKKYSFNQYSSTPLLYTSNNPQVSTYGQYTSAPQNGSLVVSQSQPVAAEYAGYQPEQQQQHARQQVVGQFQQPDPQIRPQFNYIASSSPQQNVYGQSSSAPTYTQYTMTATPGFTIVTSSPQQLPFTAQPPPPPPPMFDMDRSRSPGGVVGEDKIRLMSPKYIPVGGRDEVLSQPPPPPRSYW